MTDVQLARNAAPSTSVQTQAMAVSGATTVQLAVTIITGTATLTLEWSNDRSNWQSLAQWTGLTSGFSSPGAVSGISGGFLRVVITATVSPLIVGTLNAEVLVPQFAGGGGSHVPPAPPV
jgi:hypothetical protein